MWATTEDDSTKTIKSQNRRKQGSCDLDTETCVCICVSLSVWLCLYSVGMYVQVCIFVVYVCESVYDCVCVIVFV